MEDIREKKQEIRDEIKKCIDEKAEEDLKERLGILEERLFSFANFQEANVTLLSANREYELDTMRIIQRSLDLNKVVVLPGFDPEKYEMTLMKIDHPDKDLIKGPLGNMEPDPARCKVVPIDCIDIAVIPGLAFDEKGGRIGTGHGFYDRLIPKLPITTRKVSLTFEDQVVQQIPMESHDKYVDIIITDKRIIYKI